MTGFTEKKAKKIKHLAVVLTTSSSAAPPVPLLTTSFQTSPPSTPSNPPTAKLATRLANSSGSSM